ncbi:MAG: hypothetical protein ACRC8P_03750 [Spiroplasma sp.]
MTLFQILCIIAGIFFFLPFIIWQYFRFQEKVRHSVKWWYHKALIISWATFMPLALIFLILAFFI